MIFKNSVIADLTIGLQRKKYGEKELTGKLLAMRPTIRDDKDPVLTILCGSSNLDCKKDSYNLRSITMITGGISVSSFFTVGDNSQTEAWSSLTKIFLELTSQDRVSPQGFIDWDKITDVGNDSSNIIIVGRDSATKTENIEAKTTTAKTVDKPVYIRRRNKKPSQNHFNSLREKIKAIANNTYEPNIPVINVVLNDKDVNEIEVDDHIWADCGLA